MVTKMLRAFGAGVLVSVLASSTIAAQSPSSDDPAARAATLQQLIASLRAAAPSSAGGSAEERALLEALTERLEELDQELRVLQRKLEIEREQAAEKAKTTPAVIAGRDGFSLKSADGDFQVRFRGYLQADGRFVGDEDTTSGPTLFTLRRVRPIFEATAFKIFDFRVMPDFGGGTTVLQDAYADLKFAPWFRVRAGKYKAPFGLERLESATELAFVERGTPTLIAPNRDLGVTAFGDVAKERISYALGVFNGVVDGGSTDTDDHSGKDVVGRVFALPFKQASADSFKELGFGIAGSIGTQRGNITTPNLPAYKSSAQQTFFRYRSDGTADGTAFADGRHWRVGPQAYYYVNSVGFLTEYYISSQRVRRGAVSDDVQATAWQVSAVYALSGEKESYRGIVPRKVFDRAKGGWGGLELTARYGQLTVDDSALPLFANPSVAAREARDSVVGLNWYLNRNVKLTGQFETTQFDGGAANGADRPTERGVFTRLQFAF
jgi:phosphate-selective porin OprO and OprP